MYLAGKLQIYGLKYKYIYMWTDPKVSAKNAHEASKICSLIFSGRCG